MTKRRGPAAPANWIAAHRTDREPADLEDVIGLKKAKRELVGLAVRLTKPSGQTPIPRGILLWGPPGCGKTLLARVLANLLGGTGGSVPMYAFGATELLDGDGFRLIGDHFAVRSERAVVFVDEIDLVGRGRDDARHTADTRRALYGALAALDGLRRHDRIVWLLATSRGPWALDEALLRRGRIDVVIEVEYPDQAEREQLLAQQLARLPVAGDLDLPRAAAMLGHRVSPAAITAVCHDAFALALADGQATLDWPHLAEAIRRDGHVGADDEGDEVRWRTAVHEAGHAITAHVVGQPLANVTILSRDGGRTDMEDLKARLHTHTDEVLTRVVTVKLAGLAAESLLLATPSMGCQSDIDSATSVALARLDAGFEPAFGPISRSRVEQSTRAADEAFGLVQRYLRERFAEAERIVAGHEPAVRHFAETLLATRQLSGERLADALTAAFTASGEAPPVGRISAIANDYTREHSTGTTRAGDGRCERD